MPCLINDNVYNEYATAVLIAIPISVPIPLPPPVATAHQLTFSLTICHTHVPFSHKGSSGNPRLNELIHRGTLEN